MRGAAFDRTAGMSLSSVGGTGNGAVVVLSTLSALASLATMAAIGWIRAGGFEYPLDDTYIHLGVARAIGAGGYGLNPGEFSSPDSSFLFPFLLVPFVGSPLAVWAPIFLDVIGVFIAALGWAFIVQASRIQPSHSYALALVGPLCLNFAGVGWLGMENILHTAASLWALYGFVRFLESGRVGPALWISVPLMTALRLEGLAFGILLAGGVAFKGGWKDGAFLGALAIIPAVVFVGMLLAMGLAPLPSSVLIKAVQAEDAQAAPASNLYERVAENFTHPSAVLLALLVAVFAIYSIRLLRSERTDDALLALVLMLSGVAHLLFARFGWMNRYENYIITLLIAGLGVTGRDAINPAIRMLAMSSALMGAALVWLPTAWGDYLNNPWQIRHQQAQMARFVRDFAPVPVAVNDLGRVAWESPTYVLDLWGLASAEARKLRAARDGSDWMGPLAAEHNVKLAMIYRDWFPRIGDDWVELGTLDSSAGGPAFLGGYEVTFYATDPSAAAELLTDLRQFVPTLPEGAAFTFKEEGSP